MNGKLDSCEHLQNMFEKVNILYDQTFNNSFHESLKLIQYNVALALAGAIRGSSRENI